MEYDDSNRNEEKHNSRVNVPEQNKILGDSETEKEKYSVRDQVTNNLSTDVLRNPCKSSKSIMEEPGSSTTVLPVNLERRKSEHVGSDMEMCVLAKKISSHTRSLEKPGQCRQQLSIKTDDTAPNLQLGEF